MGEGGADSLDAVDDAPRNAFIDALVAGWQCSNLKRRCDGVGHCDTCFNYGAADSEHACEGAACILSYPLLAMLNHTRVAVSCALRGSAPSSALWLDCALEERDRGLSGLLALLASGAWMVSLCCERSGCQEEYSKVQAKPGSTMRWIMHSHTKSVEGGVKREQQLEPSDS